MLALGDGLVAGDGSPDGGGFRKYIFQSAMKDKKKMTFVGDLTSGPTTFGGVTFPRAHEGRAQAKIDSVAGQAAALLTKHKPHVILLAVGSEDIRSNTDVAGAPTRLLKLVDSIAAAAPGAQVVVITPPAIDPGWQVVKDTQWNFKAWQFETAVANGIADRFAKDKKHVGIVRLWLLMAGANAASIPENATAPTFNDKYVSGLIWVWSSQPANIYNLNDSSNAPNLVPKGGYETAASFIYPSVKKYLH